MDYKVLYKQFVASSATPWRQIVNVKKIDVCKLLKIGSGLPTFQNFLEYLQEIMPTFFKECPQKVPYHFEALNINASISDDDGTKWFLIPMANGIYRTTLKLWSDNDAEVFQIQWQAETNFVKNINIMN
jgi:hypothetical protein